MIKVLAKVDAILGLVAEGKSVEFGLIRKTLGMHKSTLSQILSCMVDLDWLARNRTGAFHVGPRMLALARPALARESLRYAAAEAVTWLASETGGVACAAMLISGRRVRLAKKEGEGEIVVDEDRFGKETGLVSTATGRLLLAFEPREQWTALSGRTQAKDPALYNDLERIRETGLASQHSANAHGVSFARGIFGPDGALLAAIGIALPVYALPEMRESRITALVRAAANMAEHLLRGADKESTNG